MRAWPPSLCALQHTCTIDHFLRIDEPFRKGLRFIVSLKNRIKIREIVNGLQENPMRFDMKWLA